MNAIWTIARRELKAMFDHPTGYVLIVIFVAINDFLFFRSVFLQGAATIRPMLDLLPWLFLFFVPAIAMRSLADDARTGALEVVLAQPVTELELLLGKYLGQLLVVWIGLAATLPVPIALEFGGHLPIGVLAAQYFGAALLGAGLTGVGVWASSLTHNQVTAFIIAVAIGFVLILVGLDPLLVGLPPVAATIAARLGVLSHFRDIGRGVIDLRDVLYFLTLAGVFLALAYAGLLRRKLSKGGAALKRLRLGTALLVGGMVVLDLLGGYIGGRLDLTPGHAYTLSPATKRILGGLDDLVTIRLFVSKKLPPQIALLRRDLDDLLSGYRTAGHGNVRIVEEDPSSGSDVADQARRLGVEPVQFNVLGRSQASVQEGWFGLAVRYQDRTAAIPLIRRTDDLEYRLTSMIHGFVGPSKKKTVGLAIGTAARDADGFGQLRQELGRTYDVRDIDLAGGAEPGAGVDVLVALGEPDSLPAAAHARLTAFFQRGGSALIITRGLTPNPEYPVASGGPIAWNDVLRPYGVRIRADLVDDLLSNRPVAVPTSLGRMVTPYPLWVDALSTGESPVDEEISGVFLPWTSSIDTTGARAGTVVPLLTTSPRAGSRSGMVSLSPEQSFPDDSLSRRLLAVQVNPLQAAAGNESSTDSAVAPRGRIIVVGDEALASDRFIENAPENLDFALNAVDWLAQDSTLMRIRSKTRVPPPLAFSSDRARDLAKYANVLGVPLVLVMAGFVRLWERRRKTHRHYAVLTPTGGAA